MQNFFDGLLVLDLSTALAGPYCAQMLGDLGADVIKIENPKMGDVTRVWGAKVSEHIKSYYASCNRNKKAITLNLKSEEGLALLYRLAEKADVIIENFRPGVTKKLKSDYPHLKARNEKLIYTSITGYGSEGPDARKPGYDLIAQGMGGVMGMTGHKDGMPTKVGVSIGDLTAGIFAAHGTLVALLQRETNQVGQLVETSLLETQVALLTFQAHKYFATGISPTRAGNEHPDIAPYETIRTNDGFINIGIANEKFWNILCETMDMQTLVNDPRFSDNAQRVANRHELVAIIEERVKDLGKKELLEKISSHGIPCGPINSIKEVFDYPQVKHLKLEQEIEHPVEGAMKMIGTAIRYSENPVHFRMAPPLQGEHNEDIISGLLGTPQDEIDRLKQAEII